MKKKFIIILLLCISLIGCSGVDKKIEQAVKLTESGEYDEAIEIYKSIIEKKPSDYKPYIGLAKNYKLVGSAEFIEKILKEGIEKADDKISIKLFLIDYYIDCFEFEKAEKLSLEILKEDDQNLEAYEKLLYIYDQVGNVETIQKIYDEYNRGKIPSNKGDLYLAKSYLRMGDKSSAEITLDYTNKDKLKDIPLYYAIDYGINNEEGLDLIDVQTGDINGDGEEENILLVASNNDGMASEIIKILLQSPKDGSILDEISLSDFMGYPYNLKLVDINNDNVLDVLVSVHSGGSSDARVHYLFSYKDNEMENYCVHNFNDVKSFFIDDYKAKIYSEEADKTHIVDFDEERKQRYYEEGHYNKEGKLLSQELSLGGTRETDVDPIFIPELNKYGLKVGQTIMGPSYNGDTIADFEVISFYDDGKWTTYDLYTVDNIVDENQLEENSQEIDQEDLNKKFCKDLKYLDSIFALNKDQVYEKFGEPNDIGMYEVEYLEYDGFTIFGWEDKVTSIWLWEDMELFGLDLAADIEDIKNTFGEHMSELFEDKDGNPSHILCYEVGEYSLYFERINDTNKYFLQIWH